MAHELTHALQDSESASISGEARRSRPGQQRQADNKHIANDDTDTSREAVLEGQAMVSFADYMLADAGHPEKTLKDAPQLAQQLNPTPATCPTRLYSPRATRAAGVASVSLHRRPRL